MSEGQLITGGLELLFYLLPVFNLLDPSSSTEKIVTSMDSLVRKPLPFTATYLFVFEDVKDFTMSR